MAMPAAPEHPTTAHIHGMCLLHADFHPMDGTCWAATADWFFTHEHLPEAQARDWYQLEVERAMLDTIARTR